MSQIRKKFIATDAIDESKILLSNDGALRARNNADSADVEILKLTTADVIQFLSVPQSPSPAVNANDLVILSQIQSLLEGLKPKEAVKIATTENITLSGLQTIDGILTVAGDRVLVKNQTTQSQNGIYTAATGAWVRADDFDSLTPTDEINGALVAVQEGTANAGKILVQTGNVTTLETDAIIFVFFNSSTTLTGGDGITLTSGTDIDIDLATNSGLELTASDGTGQLRIKGLADYSATALPDQVAIGYNATGELILDTTTIALTGGDGIDITSGTVSIDLVANRALQSTGGQLDLLIDGVSLTQSATGITVAVDGIKEAEIDTTVVDAETFLISTVYDSSIATGNVTVGDTVQQAIEKIESKVDNVVGGQIQQTFTLTAGDIVNGFVTLSGTPLNAIATLMVQGGGAQLQGIDYTIATNILTFAGGLSSGTEALELGNVIQVTYLTA